MNDLIFLFASSFLAATIFPAGSEVLLATLSAAGNHDKFLLSAIATIGNVLGALVNWSIGYYFAKFKNRKWFPFSDKQIQKSSFWFNKYGQWSLLFAWVPFFGDPLTFVAGTLKTNFFKFLLLVSIGKSTRYFILIYLLNYTS